MTKSAVSNPHPDSPAPPPVIESRQLLKNADEVLIRHQGQFYRLRCTRQGRLILTK
ncbi:MAG: hemin uptake protein HemP [Candidatus Competibacteraceae bacterium]|nr:hemin uptake protein HemP [Candidatus Competibacteraceae bacterium]